MRRFSTLLSVAAFGLGQAATAQAPTAATAAIAASAAPCRAHIAIIGGTYLNDALLKSGRLGDKFAVTTPIGDSPAIWCGKAGGVAFYYVHSHGGTKRVEMWSALMQLGVTDAVGGATVGGINPSYKVRDYVVADDFIDLNVERPRRLPAAIFPPDQKILARYTPPTDPQLGEILARSTETVTRSRPSFADIHVHRGGVLIQAAGGRFETPAEVRLFAQMGGDVVTLNIGSEMAYARMAGIAYSSLSLVSNPAEGLAPWTMASLSEIYRELNPLSVDILVDALPKIAALGGQSRVPDDLRIHPETTAVK